jgi:hypothetical protein
MRRILFAAACVLGLGLLSGAAEAKGPPAPDYSTAQVAYHHGCGPYHRGWDHHRYYRAPCWHGYRRPC